MNLHMQHILDFMMWRGAENEDNDYWREIQDRERQRADSEYVYGLIRGDT